MLKLSIISWIVLMQASSKCNLFLLEEEGQLKKRAMTAKSTLGLLQVVDFSTIVHTGAENFRSVFRWGKRSKGLLANRSRKGKLGFRDICDQTWMFQTEKFCCPIFLRFGALMVGISRIARCGEHVGEKSEWAQKHFWRKTEFPFLQPCQQCDKSKLCLLLWEEHFPCKQRQWLNGMNVAQGGDRVSGKMTFT